MTIIAETLTRLMQTHILVKILKQATNHATWLLIYFFHTIKVCHPVQLWWSLPQAFFQRDAGVLPGLPEDRRGQPRLSHPLPELPLNSHHGNQRQNIRGQNHQRVWPP